MTAPGVEHFGGSSVTDINANGVGGGPFVVEIKSSDAGFESSHCAHWVRVE